MNINRDQYYYSSSLYKTNYAPSNPYERRRDYSNSLGIKNNINRPKSSYKFKRTGNPSNLYQTNNIYNNNDYNINYYPNRKEKEKPRQNNFYDILNNRTTKYNFNDNMLYENKKERPLVDQMNHIFDDEKYKYKTSYLDKNLGKENNDIIPKRFQFGGRFEHINDDFLKINPKTEIYKFQNNYAYKNNNENEDNIYRKTYQKKKSNENKDNIFRTTFQKNTNDKNKNDNYYFRDYFDNNILKNEKDKDKINNNEKDKMNFNKNENKNTLFNNLNNTKKKEIEIKIINNKNNNKEKNNEYDNNIEKNNDYNKKEINNKKSFNKDPELISATSTDYLEEEINSKTTSHHKSNKYHSKSVNPYTNTTTNEVFNITNSLIGLNNLGSTCYMNSALQNIIHCKKLIEKLILLKDNNSRLNQNLTNSFINLCYNLIEKKYSNESKYISSYLYSLNSYSPSSFKREFCLKHSEYNRGQHDSIEFLRTLLDDISKEININKNIYKELTTEGKSKVEQNKEYHNFFIGRENSIIIDIFYIQIINIFTCKCGYESYSFQKLLDIPLLLPNKIREISLISLIKEYLKEESLDWSSKCEKCKASNLKHIKKIKFSMLNDVIIFSLQRFDPFYSMKSSIYVSYDEIIDLNDFCDFDLYRDSTKYRLFGTINHIGNINYGHYYAYVRIGEIWYEFNDSIVKKINCMDLKSSSVCVLFYEKL